MTNCILDLRGKSLRFLVADGSAVRHQGTVDGFSLDEPEAASAAIEQISRTTGTPLKAVHVILPDEWVIAATHRLPALSAADAAKVIRRKLAPGQDGAEPLFHITPLSGGDRSSYLVETLDRVPLAGLVAFFQARGIAVSTVTTSLHANHAALHRVHPDLKRQTVIIDLGRSHLQFFVQAGSHLLFSWISPAPPVDPGKDAASGASPERVEKMRVYRIVESVYSAYVAYQKEYPDTAVAGVWLTGVQHELRGMADVLKESMGVEVSVANPLGAPGADDACFTAAFGHAAALQDGSAVNLLPQSLAPGYQRRRSILRAAAAVLVLVLVVSAVLVEARYRRMQTAVETRRLELETRRQEFQGSLLIPQDRGRLSQLLQQEPVLYPFFGYLADNMPDQVYIAGVSCTRKDGRSVIVLDFITPPVSEIGTRRLLSKIVSMMDRSGMVTRHGEPVLATKRQANTLYQHFKVTCEVLSR